MLVIPVLVNIYILHDITINDITNLHITCMLIIYNSIPSVLKYFSNSQGCAGKVQGSRKYFLLPVSSFIEVNHN